MSKDPKNSGRPAGNALPVQDIAAEVQRLIAADKSKQAVELAKDEHKRRNTPDSERLLVDAYLARIRQFQDKGAAEDARTLLKLVRERFPAHAQRLADLERQTAAMSGNISELVSPLARPDLPDEARNAIETAIRQQIVNLGELAGTPVLPDEHPLKKAAGAVWSAFHAVTQGPVTDEQIALPEVSRRSPLAGWKMLIRAIAAFHQHDDEGCRRAMQGIPEDSAAAKLASILIAMLEGRSPGKGFAGALHSRVGGDDQALRKALEHVEQAIRDHDDWRLRKVLNEALSACVAARPEMVEHLRQQMIGRCVLESAPMELLHSVFMDARKDAQFWRLVARAADKSGNSPVAAFYWERFVRHAIHERLIQPGSLEEATVWLHIARMVARIDPNRLADEIYALQCGQPLAGYYSGQPPEIAALKPPSNAQIAGTIYNVGQLYERVSQLDPDPQTFAEWWTWAVNRQMSNRDKETIAQTWHRLLPQDPQPLLRLSALAEERNALKLALKHLSAAEPIDALNPAVRKARLRLTLATAWRHFKDRKPHLVEQDLADLDALPAMREGDRPALLSALRAAWHAMRQDKPAAQQAADALVGQSGPLMAGAVLDAVQRRTAIMGLAWPVIPGVALPEPRAVAETTARAIRLAEDVDLTIFLFQKWDTLVDQVLRQTPCPLSHSDLLAIGRGAISRQELKTAYQASTAGLALAIGPAAARFFLLRSRALPPYAHRRAKQCLRAAMDLAQQANDPDLMAEISAAIDRQMVTFRRPGSQRLGDELLADVMKQERLARTFPANVTEADKHLVAIDPEPSLFTQSGQYDDEYDDEYDEDEDEDYDGNDYEDDELEDDEFDGPLDGVDDISSMLGAMSPEMLKDLAKQMKLPKGLPPAVVPILLKMVAKYGRPMGPDELAATDPALARELADVMGIDLYGPDEPPGPFGGGGGGRRGGKKKRKRRR